MTRICNCGDCRSAYERAAGLITKMFRDNECPSYAIAVGEAMKMMASAMQVARLHGEGYDPISSIVAVNDHENELEKKLALWGVGDGRKLYNELCGDLAKEMSALGKRYKADHEAIKKDSPDIKKGG